MASAYKFGGVPVHRTFGRGVCRQNICQSALRLQNLVLLKAAGLGPSPDRMKMGPSQYGAIGGRVAP
jgi:hypothetical protein